MSKLKQVVKRSGKIVAFDSQKIYNAIQKANKEVNNLITNKEISDVVDSVIKLLEADEKRIVSVEEIQDCVEQSLVMFNFFEIAKAYILYRKKRTEIREAQKHLVDNYNDIFFTDSSNIDLKRDNANINGDASMGIMLKMGAESSKYYALNHVVSEKFAKAHKEKYIHIHDLDFSLITFNCLVVDMVELLRRGFNTGHGFLRPPQSIRSYANLECIAIQSSQNDMYGGQSVGNHDFAMAEGIRKSFKKAIKNKLYEGMAYLCPNNNMLDEVMQNVVLNDIINNIDWNKIRYTEASSVERDKAINDLKESFRITIKNNKESYNEHDCYYFLDLDKDDLLDKVYLLACKQVENETHQAMEAVIHNFNSLHSRAGGQTPFSSLNYGMDTSPEGRLAIKETLNAIDAGLGDGETPIFPISIFLLKDGVNYSPEDPNYDLFKLACKVSAKRLFPNFCSLDAPFNLQHYREGDYHSYCNTMGCVSGQEIITYRIKGTNYTTTESFEEAYNKLKQYFPEQTSGQSKYLNTDQEVEISDAYSVNLVNCRKFIKNPPIEQCYLITFDNGRSLIATENHPLPVFTKGRTYVKDLTCGDCIPASDVVLGGHFEHSQILPATVHVSSIKPIDYKEPVYDVETDSDHFDVSGINSHNCRTRTIENINGPAQSVKRGNFAFVTINLPKIAIESNGDLDAFFNKFDEYIQLSHDYLLERLAIIESKHVYNFPFLMGEHLYLGSENLKPTDTIKEVLKHASYSIGFCGLAECLIALIGKHHGESTEAQKLGLKIITHLRQKTDEYKEKEHRNWGTFATPAENLAGEMQRSNKKTYGIIKGVTDRDYMTNSFHCPVYYPISAINKIKVEAPYHELCNAGHISYIEMDGDPSKNLKAFESIVRAMHDNNMGYFSINHPVDRDPVCGYTGIIENECPHCHRKEVEHKQLRMKKLSICCDN